jgi:N-acetylmuramoyl-L-alanine amidase
MSKVFIGVGHGGSDPGAVAGAVREKDLNINIATYCNEVLLRHGVVTKMSRYGDEEDSLAEEIRECNAFAPDLAIDIHNNAGGGNGAEAFYHYGGGLSKNMAENVLAEIVKIGQNSRGAKTKLNDAGRDWFGFIRETVAPAVIVECAFVDNAEDMTIIDTEEKRKAMGVAIAKGILSTLSIPFVPFIEHATEQTPEPDIVPEPITEVKTDAEKEEKKKKIIDVIIKFLEWLMALLKGE